MLSYVSKSFYWSLWSVF